MSKKEYPVKTVYYEDLLHDDFAKNKFEKKALPKGFKFAHKNPVYRFFASVVYYLIAIPVLWIGVKLFFCVKVVGKKKFKRAKYGKTGVFMYGNHTANIDALVAPALIIPPIHVRIICSVEAVSVPLIRGFEAMIGALPLPDEPSKAKDFVDAVEYYAKKKNAILIFPEAHIWPYCTFIRPFPEQSFNYPAKLGIPVCALCATYERRKVFKNRPPRMVVHVSDPIYPDMDLPLGERTKQLRDAAYEFMVETSSSLENVEYWRYLPKGKDE